MQSSFFHHKGEQTYKKIFCAYHPHQFLTNFCLKSQCLMPLCPTCIHEHSEEHYQLGTKPNYINLNDALQQAKENCYEQIVELQNLQRQGSKVGIQRERAVENIRKQLREFKQQVYVKLQEQFSKYQNELLQKLKSYNEENIEVQKEMQINKYNIQKGMTQLYQKIGFLKGEQCLSALITYHNKQQEEFSLLSKQIQISLNKFGISGKLQASLDMMGLNTQIKGIFNRIIQIKQVNKSKINYQQIRDDFRSIDTPQKKSRSPYKLTPKSRSRISNESLKKNEEYENVYSHNKRSKFNNSSYYD